MFNKTNIEIWEKLKFESLEKSQNFSNEFENFSFPRTDIFDLLSINNKLNNIEISDYSTVFNTGQYIRVSNGLMNHEIIISEDDYFLVSRKFSTKLIFNLIKGKDVSKFKYLIETEYYICDQMDAIYLLLNKFYDDFIKYINEKKLL